MTASETKLATKASFEGMEKLILKGDLSSLTPPEKIQYYNGFCQRLGLDPFTQPFKILKLNGKEVLYCDRSGTQQLSKLHSVSHEIKAREIINDCYVVTAQASTPDGRHTESIGAVAIAGLKGDAMCNAMMKSETKAKRRATLDLLGLGVLDETEVESIPVARTMDISDWQEEPAPTKALPEGHTHWQLECGSLWTSLKAAGDKRFANGTKMLAHLIDWASVQGFDHDDKGERITVTGLGSLTEEQRKQYATVLGDLLAAEKEK